MKICIRLYIMYDYLYYTIYELCRSDSFEWFCSVRSILKGFQLLSVCLLYPNFRCCEFKFIRNLVLLPSQCMCFIRKHGFAFIWPIIAPVLDTILIDCVWGCSSYLWNYLPGFPLIFYNSFQLLGLLWFDRTYMVCMYMCFWKYLITLEKCRGIVHDK